MLFNFAGAQARETNGKATHRQSACYRASLMCANFVADNFTEYGHFSLIDGHFQFMVGNLASDCPPPEWIQVHSILTHIWIKCLLHFICC